MIAFFAHISPQMYANAIWHSFGLVIAIWFLFSNEYDLP
jgi:hypothetical protein